MTIVASPTFVDVAPVAALIPDRGVAVLVEGRQVAVFALSDGTVHAVANRDPFSGANVLSRGIVGDRGGRAVVASPVYKQCFELTTGRCLEDPEVAIDVHEVTVLGGRVLVRLQT